MKEFLKKFGLWLLGEYQWRPLEGAVERARMQAKGEIPPWRWAQRLEAWADRQDAIINGKFDELERKRLNRLLDRKDREIRRELSTRDH